MLRSGNKAAAVLTLLGDAGKGLLAVVLAKHFTPTWGLDDDAIAIIALAVFLGHIWSVFLYFRGGRGVATALGVAIGLNLWAGLLAIVTWVIVAAIWRISSLSALVAAVLTPVYAWIFLGFETASTLVIFIMSLLLIWRHKSNIANLISGKEARIGKSSTP
jgi:glycerol-3-phosphate acyltransferase PlsY